MKSDSIPISFIELTIQRYERYIDYELYEAEESDWRPIIQRDALVRLIREWREYENSEDNL